MGKTVQNRPVPLAVAAEKGHRTGTVLRLDSIQLFGDDRVSLIPCDRFKPAISPLTYPLERRFNNVPTKVLTGEVRLSYVNLVQPRVNNNDPTATPKYSVTLLIPKTDTAVKQNIDASIEAAAADAQGKIWNGVRPPVMPIPIHDGDGVRENGTPYGPECKGCWVITASSKNKPQVVHQSDINTELLPQDIYSGMYARVTINFFGYNRAGKRGVGCGLGNVMKTRDGEALAGGASAAADFAGVGMEAGAPATPAYGAAMPATPGQMTYPNTGMQQPNPLGVQPGAINPLTGQPYFG